ncbi:hypothetical protein DOM21_07850 [Bacteriovorax stolpii]|uniref:Uncharacterized protein n=1 Tax=Bacteriovorax stolpii TaxID=960 RepID=A0A2K9NT28_BACTC|nr:hypothetical protein [Bacteriovorax stolpii]AUN98652.1 hypothetical protein C0V70_11170 [Bacteriovorax stolpii]QDK41368.1 hypothetical protein DOM21_07850 [Bacteriovorax stolpii]TDP55841.1 hypothetical protein C8D79_0898 [Bacteriovorax stolpii]
MAAIKLKKINWQRRRFIASGDLHDLDLWMDADQTLKKRILTDSTYQLVGKKSIVEISTKTGKGRLLLEVVGVPKTDLPTFDVEAQTTLIWESPKEAFKVDFSALKVQAQQVIKGSNLAINDTYHIVLDGPKLELHFFIQKDYIHS